MTSDAGGDQDTALWSALFEEQVRLHAPLFFKLAFDILRNATAAEDACQAGFARAWEQRRQVGDRGKLRAWITRVIVNECLVVLRRRHPEREARDRWLSVAAAANGGPTVDLLALRESLLIALAGLPDETRTVVVHRVMQGMSGNEVKDLLGCSASAVSVRLHRGMEQLRELLSDWDPAS